MLPFADELLLELDPETRQKAREALEAVKARKRAAAAAWRERNHVGLVGTRGAVWIAFSESYYHRIDGLELLAGWPPYVPGDEHESAPWWYVQAKGLPGRAPRLILLFKASGHEEAIEVVTRACPLPEWWHGVQELDERLRGTFGDRLAQRVAEGRAMLDPETGRFHYSGEESVDG